MSAPCKYCGDLIEFGKTRAGIWKVLDLTPIGSYGYSESQNNERWVWNKTIRALVSTRDIPVLAKPVPSYASHTCAEYLEARTIAPIPALGEQGIVKVSDSPELISLLAELETREAIKQAKEARKVREQLTERERNNVE